MSRALGTDPNSNAQRQQHRANDGALIDAVRRTRITCLGRIVEAAVTGSDGSAYRVLVGAGVGACSCPRARFAARGSGPCKHVQALELIVGALPAELLADRQSA